MSRKLKGLVYTTLFVLTVYSIAPAYANAEQPQVIQGQLDLSSWDFHKSGPVDLREGWTFYWNQLLVKPPSKPEGNRDNTALSLIEPEAGCEIAVQGYQVNSLCNGYSFNPKAFDKKGQKVKAIHYWKLNGFSETGYAIYKIDLVLPNNQKVVLYPKTYKMFSWAATRVWVLKNSKYLLLSTFGNPLTGPQTRHSISDMPVELPPGKNTLFIEVANYQWNVGGLNLLSLKSKTKKMTSFYAEILLKALIAGSILMAGIYHFIIFLLRRSLLSSLWFSLVCFTLSARVYAYDRFFELINPVADLFALLVKIEFISMPLSSLLFLVYIQSLFKKFRNRQILNKVLFSLYCALCVFLAFSKISFVTGNTLLLQLSVLIAVIYSLYAIISSFGSEEIGEKQIARRLIVAFCILAGTILYDIIANNLGYTNINLSTYGLLFFIIANAYILAKQNASAWASSESLAIELKSEIKEKTELQVSNEELASRQKKFTRLIEDLSLQYAQAGEQLEAAKSEQAQITQELEEASRQLIQAEKLSGLGAMVSGIAHDINNPLNFIETARFQEQEKLDQLKEHLLGLVPEGEEGEEFKADLLARFEKLGKLNDQIKTGVTRVTEISKSMRNASRADTEKTNDVNLVEVIKESLIITGNKVKQFQLVNNIPDGITLATCNRSQIGQVVMNFLSNAADALAEYKVKSKDHKGIIQLDLAINNQSKDQNQDQNQQKTVQISVTDNGAGVPQENRDKVLNAFFTTKAAGAGTGLGLAICGKIAQAHEGTIHIEDGLENDQGGHGARFTLEFSG